MSDLPLVLDVEVTGGQSPATIRAAAQTWLDLVEAGTGKRPLIYSYASFLEDNLGIRIDLATRAALKSRIKPGIEAEAIRVA